MKNKKRFLSLILVLTMIATMFVAVSPVVQADVTTYSIPISKDTYIEGTSNVNYGSSTELKLALGGAKAANTRIPYFQFTLPADTVVQNIASAKLKLKIKTTNLNQSSGGKGPSDETAVVYIAPTDWEEMVLNATNAPERGSEIMRTVISQGAAVNSWIEFDITNYVKSKQAGDDIAVSIELTATAALSFYSREDAEENRPYIEVTANPEQPVIDAANAINIDTEGAIPGYKLTSATTFRLPVSSINNTTISWSSDDPCISVQDDGSGTYTPPAVSKICNLTATVTNGTATVTRVFKITCLNNENAVAPDNLIALYTFDAFAEDGNVPDASGNGNNAIVLNDNASLTLENGAVRFPGNQGDGQIGAALKLPDNFNNQITDNYTISMWIKPEALGNTTSRLFDLGSKGSSGDNLMNSIFVQYQDNGTLYMRDRTKGTSAENYAMGNYVFTDKWYLVTMIHNNGTTTLYIDGAETLKIEKGSAAEMRSLGELGDTSGLANGLFIGRTQWAYGNRDNINGNQDFKGLMDDIRIYSRALTYEEVLYLYENSDTFASNKMPSNVSVVPTSTTAAVSWEAVDGATGYNVYRAEAEAGPYTKIITNQAGTTVRDRELEPLKQYYYRVSSVSEAGESALTLPVSCTTTDRETNPSTLSCTSKTIPNVVLSWESVTGATGYKLYRSNTEDGEATLIYSGTATSYTDSSIVAGGIYYYKMTYLNVADEESDKSNTVRVIPVYEGAPEIVLDSVDYTLYKRRTHNTVLSLLNGDTSSDITSDATFASSDNNIASVNSVGVVTGINEGTATITVTYGGKAYYANVTVKEDMVLWYKFDEASGTVVNDASGHEKHGTVYGGAVWIANEGLSLDGVDDYVQMPNGILKDITDITVSAKVFVKTDNDRPTWIFSFCSVNDAMVEGSRYFGLLEDSSGKFRSSISVNRWTGEQTVNKESAMVRGQWKTITVTLSGDTGRIYEDGVLVAESTNIKLDPKDIEETIANYIGKCSYPDKMLKAVITDFRIYNRALSAEEIALLSSDFEISTKFNLGTLQANKQLQATVNINNTTGYAQNIIAIMALYDENNTLLDVAYDAESIADGARAELTPSFTLPSNVNGCKVKVFVWEGSNINSSDMKPVSGVFTLN